MKYLINLLLLVCLATSISQAATITAVVDGGDWNNGATWSGGVVPAAGDDVIIPNGITVNLSTDMITAIATLTVQNGGTLDGNTNEFNNVTGSITIDAGGTITNISIMDNLTANILNNGSFSVDDIVTTGTITNNGTLFFVDGDIEASGFYNTTPATISGDLVFVDQAVCCGELFNNSSTLTVDKIEDDLETYPKPVGTADPGDYYTFENSGLLNIGDELKIDGYFTNTATGTINATGAEIHVDGLFCNLNTDHQSIIVEELKLDGGMVTCGGAWQVEIIELEANDAQTNVDQPGFLQSFYFCRADGTPPIVNEGDPLDPDEGVIDSANVSFCGVILPVVLVEFKAKLINENDINIQWKTSSELRNSYFELMYSHTGRDFATIGTVQGNGNTDQTSNYNFIHSPNEGNWAYYRLKQVDFDGVYENSKIIAVKRSNLLQTGYIRISPNPAIDNLEIKYNFPKENKQKGFIQIWNLQGISVKRILLENSEGIKNIDVNELKSGLYFLSFPNGKSKKFLKK